MMLWTPSVGRLDTRSMEAPEFQPPQRWKVNEAVVVEGTILPESGAISQPLDMLSQ